MRFQRTHAILATFLAGLLVLTGLLVLRPQSRELLGRVLEGDAFLRVQAESDFDRDGDIDFLDFTVFSAFYEEDV